MKMIPYNVHYEIGASLLMILLLCCIVGKKRLRTRSNNLFLCNVCLLIVGNLIDVRDRCPGIAFSEYSIAFRCAFACASASNSPDS